MGKNTKSVMKHDLKRTRNLERVCERDFVGGQLLDWGWQMGTQSLG
jgi:hypothetical protein